MKKNMKKYHKLMTRLIVNRGKHKNLRNIEEKTERDILKLIEEENLIQQQIIKETKMLSVSPLTLNVYDERVFLTGSEKNFEELSELLRSCSHSESFGKKDWSVIFEMPNDAVISIMHSYIVISFERNPAVIEEFIKEYEINVDIGSFSRAKGDLESKLKQINSIVSRFKKGGK